MKFTHTLLASALVGLLAACSNGAQDAQPPAEAATQAAPEAASPATAMAPAATAMAPAAASTVAAAPEGMNWFGGPIYTGEPALAATAALIKAGGGADNFSFQTALVSMLGEKTVNAEVEKLTKQYGADEVKGFVDGMTFAVKSAIKNATAAGITLPEAPADLKGADLAKALVQAGTAPDGTFWSGYLFDKALSNKIHVLVMTDIDQAVGHAADESTHKILNQAMFDVAQALEMKDVKLASLH
ncbi:MAG TPA: hypothetical protein VLZ55_11465 [Rhodanobacter sp.]|nr:hypothetical protein [Rhodanobacter sp.]